MFDSRHSSVATPPCFKWVSGIDSQKQDRTHHSLTGVGCWRNRGRTDAPDDWTSSISPAAYLAFTLAQPATGLCNGSQSRQSDASSHSQSHVHDSQQSIDGGLAA